MYVKKTKSQQSGEQSCVCIQYGIIAQKKGCDQWG